MKAIAKMKLDTEQTMKLEELYVVGSDGELNSWLDRSFFFNASEQTSVVVTLYSSHGNCL